MSKGKTLEQLAAEYELEIHNIKLADIDPEPDNANEMGAREYEALVRDIREHGFTQPILVRPVGDRFRLIDGEHRWRAVAELGMATIPSIVIEADDDDEARLRGLTMNGLRGKFIPVKYAQVLADLAKRMPENELRQRLGIEQSQLESHLRLAKFSAGLGERIKKRGEAPRRATRQVLRFSVSPADGEMIERVVDALTDGKMERGEALALVCTEFERNRRA